MGELAFGAGGLGGVIVGVELLGVVGLGVEFFGADPFDPGVLEEAGVDDEALAAGALDDELELAEFVPVELELVELPLVASAAVEVAEAGTTAGILGGDEFVDLPPPFDFASPDFAEEPGAVTGGGVQAGASSGIAGAAGVAGRGSSAQSRSRTRQEGEGQSAGQRAAARAGHSHRRFVDEEEVHHSRSCVFRRAAKHFAAIQVHEAASRMGRGDRDFVAGRDSAEARARIDYER